MEEDTEHTGCLRIPTVDQRYGVWLLVANVFVSGTFSRRMYCLGTMISACTDREQDQTDCAVFFCGVAQFILGFILIGWVWSLFWGVKIYSKSRPKVRVVSTNTVQIMEHS